MFQRQTNPIIKSYFYKYSKNKLYTLNIKKNHIFTIIFFKLDIFHNFSNLNLMITAPKLFASAIASLK